MPFTFPVEDITQEVRIKIWEKLVQDYDANISAPRTFIIAYLPNTYRGIVYHMEACLKYTGNTDAHMTRGRRTQSGTLRKNLIYLHDHKGLFNYKSEQSDIEEKLDWDTIILEMQVNLNELDFEIFTSLLQGYNQSDISYLLNLSASQVSNQVKTIKTKLKEILIDLDYMD